MGRRAATTLPSRTIGRDFPGRRAALAWLTVLVVGAFAVSWIKDHPVPYRAALHAFRIYLTAWDIDIEHGFGILKRVSATKRGSDLVALRSDEFAS